MVLGDIVFTEVPRQRDKYFLLCFSHMADKMLVEKRREEEKEEEEER